LASEPLFRVPPTCFAKCSCACEFPLTQTEIADTLALSTVHVNRTLMELRRSGLITLRDKQLTLHHLPGLEAAAGFNSGYLHLEASLDDDVTAAQ